MQSFQQQDFFCQECGAANEPGAQICVACQHILPSLDEAAPVAAPLAVPVSQKVFAGAPLRSGSGGLLHGRYRLLKEIGQGGFGAVYQARDCQRRNRLVAIKKIDLSKLSSHEIIFIKGATCSGLF